VLAEVDPVSRPEIDPGFLDPCPDAFHIEKVTRLNACQCDGDLRGAATPLAAPTSPSENVQMVSTQPELPVRCCTIHAPAISADSESAIAAIAQRYKPIQNSR
jgi:hypothetical protein